MFKYFIRAYVFLFILHGNYALSGSPDSFEINGIDITYQSGYCGKDLFINGNNFGEMGCDNDHINIVSSIIKKNKNIIEVAISDNAFLMQTFNANQQLDLRFFSSPIFDVENNFSENSLYFTELLLDHHNKEHNLNIPLNRYDQFPSIFLNSIYSFPKVKGYNLQKGCFESLPLGFISNDKKNNFETDVIFINDGCLVHLAPEIIDFYFRESYIDTLNLSNNKINSIPKIEMLGVINFDLSRNNIIDVSQILSPRNYNKFKYGNINFSRNIIERALININASVIDISYNKIIDIEVGDDYFIDELIITCNPIAQANDNYDKIKNVKIVTNNRSANCFKQN